MYINYRQFRFRRDGFHNLLKLSIKTLICNIINKKKRSFIIRHVIKSPYECPFLKIWNRFRDFCNLKSLNIDLLNI